MALAAVTALLMKDRADLATVRDGQARADQENRRALADRQRAAANPAASPDWRHVAVDLRGGAKDSPGSEAEMERLRRQLDQWPAERLLAGLDEIARLELTDLERSNAEYLLISRLCEKGPREVLLKMENRLASQQEAAVKWMPWALRNWARQSPAEAAAWLDRQIQAGRPESTTLDGSNPELERFEGGLIVGMAAKDPDTAVQRMEGLSSQQRTRLLRQPVKEEDAPGYAALVRRVAPAEEVPSILAGGLSLLLYEGYGKLSAVLDRIQAQPEERRALAGLMLPTRFENGAPLREINEADLRDWRAWVGGQVPGSEDETTIQVLAAAALYPDADFTRVAQLATQYDTHGSQRILTGLLEKSGARIGAETARPWIAKITNPAKQEELSGQFK